MMLLPVAVKAEQQHKDKQWFRIITATGWLIVVIWGGLYLMTMISVGATNQPQSRVAVLEQFIRELQTNASKGGVSWEFLSPPAPEMTTNLILESIWTDLHFGLIWSGIFVVGFLGIKLGIEGIIVAISYVLAGK